MPQQVFVVPVVVVVVVAAAVELKHKGNKFRRGWCREKRAERLTS